MSVVVAAYNEAAGLPTVLNKLRRLMKSHPRYEVVVVDDGSTDETAALASSFGVRVVRHDRNKGKGAAIQSGLAVAAGEAVIMIDADDTYPVDAIPEMVDCLVDNDMVFGVRTPGCEHIPRLNRLGNWGIALLIKAMSKSRVRDPLTGLYGIRKGHLQQMNLSSTGFGIEAEIVVKAARLGLRACEHPINYSSRLGDTKLRPFRDGWRIMQTIVAHSAYEVPTRSSSFAPVTEALPAPDAARGDSVQQTAEPQ